MTIAIHAEKKKHFTKCKNLNHVNISQQSKNKGEHLHFIKKIYKENPTNFIFNGEKLDTFQIRLETREDVFSHYSYSTIYKNPD